MGRAADPREAGPVVFHDRVGVRAGADDAEKKLLFRVAAVENRSTLMLCGESVTLPLSGCGSL